MKRRKDSGFTLIELMIVIAVIGILAVVLIPKVGTVKAQAKETGLDTNVRVVQGYAESKINKWVANNVSVATVQTDIAAAFGSGKALTNPITAVTAAAPAPGLAPAADSNPPIFILNTFDGADIPGTVSTTKGTIIVAVKGATSTASVVQEIKIYAHGENGLQLAEKTATVTP